MQKNQEIDAYTILREYVQIRFLDIFFRIVKPKTIFFKGGTALRLLYGSERFSEDLDFTVPSKENPFELAKQTVIKLKSEITDISIKQIDTSAGASAKISLNGFSSNQPLTIKLDFSLREQVLMPQVAAVKTNTPVAGVSLVDALSKKEILAEKIRAVINRKKGRDLYDLWYLLHTGTLIERDLIEKKLAYYHEKFQPDSLFTVIAGWNEKDLYQDIAKFLPKSQRRIIAELPRLIQALLKNSL